MEKSQFTEKIKWALKAGRFWKNRDADRPAARKAIQQTFYQMFLEVSGQVVGGKATLPFGR